MVPFVGWGIFDWCSSYVLHNKDIHSHSLSLTHGLFASLSSLFYLLFLSGSNYDNFVWNVLRISRGYFIYDMLNVIKKTDYLYITHHTLLLVFLAFFETHRLKSMFMKCLFMGEITNPLLHIRSITKKIPKYQPYFPIVNHAFTGMFVVVRGVCIPYYCYLFLTEIANNEQISERTSNTISLCTVLFNLGNVAWLVGLLRGYRKWMLRH